MTFESRVWLTYQNRMMMRGARLSIMDPIWIRFTDLLQSHLEFSSHKYIDLLDLIGRDAEI